jgi:hypothetical protein
MEWAIGRLRPVSSRHRKATPAGLETLLGYSRTLSAKRLKTASSWASGCIRKARSRSTAYLIPFTGLKSRASLDIAPNTIVQNEGFTILKQAAILANFQPHTHLRGKAMEVEAILPDGTTQVISYVGNFNS